MDKCTIDDCDKPIYARGACSNHYARGMRNNSLPPRVFLSDEQKSNSTTESRDKWNVKRRAARLATGMKPIMPPLEESVAALFPHLIEQLHADNSTTLDKVRPGSGKVLKWVCKSGHVWETRVCHRTAGHGCIKCRPKMTEEENRASRKASFDRWYYADDDGKNHGTVRASKTRETRYLEVVARHGKECYLCGIDVSRETTHLDHVIPRNSGGSDSYDNIRITHEKCNLTKGHREWLGPDWLGYAASAFDSHIVTV